MKQYKSCAISSELNLREATRALALVSFSPFCHGLVTLHASNLLFARGAASLDARSRTVHPDSRPSSPGSAVGRGAAARARPSARVNTPRASFEFARPTLPPRIVHNCERLHSRRISNWVSSSGGWSRRRLGRRRRRKAM
jgi:hypothetical protein